MVNGENVETMIDSDDEQRNSSQSSKESSLAENNNGNGALIAAGALAAVGAGFLLYCKSLTSNAKHAGKESVLFSAEVLNNILLAWLHSCDRTANIKNTDAKNAKKLGITSKINILTNEGNCLAHIIECAQVAPKNVNMLCAKEHVGRVMKSFKEILENFHKKVLDSGIFGPDGSRPVLQKHGIPYLVSYEKAKKNTDLLNHCLKHGIHWNRIERFGDGFRKEKFLTYGLYNELVGELNAMDKVRVKCGIDNFTVPTYREFLKDNGFKMFHLFFYNSKKIDLREDKMAKEVIKEYGAREATEKMTEKMKEFDEMKKKLDDFIKNAGMNSKDANAAISAQAQADANATILVQANVKAEAIKAKAKEEAEKIKAEAQDDAQANVKAEAIKAKAKEEAEKIKAEAKAKVEGQDDAQRKGWCGKVGDGVADGINYIYNGLGAGYTYVKRALNFENKKKIN